MFQALNKKEHKGSDSPDQEHEQFVITPRTEDKYNRINQEFDMLMAKNNMQGRVSELVVSSNPESSIFF